MKALSGTAYVGGGGRGLSYNELRLRLKLRVMRFVVHGDIKGC